MGESVVDLTIIGQVVSGLDRLEDAPRQADEGAPPAWIVLDPSMTDGLQGLRAGDALVVLTWLHRGRRDVLTVHPRGDPGRPPQGVFSTRSPDRPNPIGLHQVTVTAIDGNRIRVDGLEAIDETPVLDLKPVLTAVDGR